MADDAELTTWQKLLVRVFNLRPSLSAKNVSHNIFLRSLPKKVEGGGNEILRYYSVRPCVTAWSWILAFWLLFSGPPREKSSDTRLDTPCQKSPFWGKVSDNIFKTEFLVETWNTLKISALLDRWRHPIGSSWHRPNPFFLLLRLHKKSKEFQQLFSWKHTHDLWRPHTCCPI